MGVGVKSSVLLHAEQVAEVQFAVEERGRPEDTPSPAWIRECGNGASWTESVKAAAATRSTPSRTERTTYHMRAVQEYGIVPSRIRVVTREAVRLPPELMPVTQEIARFIVGARGGGDAQTFDTRLLSFLTRELETVYPKEAKAGEAKFLESVGTLVENYTNVEYWWALRRNLLAVFNQPFREVQEHLAVGVGGKCHPQVSLEQTKRQQRAKAAYLPMEPDFCLVCGNYSEDRDDESYIIGTNPIIYCSMCHIGVHLKCVGLVSIPTTFTCDKCKYLKKGERCDDSVT